ncbi:hypothetical protein [Companilactobacillus pabuli]|uniref:hypothetical protein n=1 Tax=Companilactobacillus pabuli TaxID=2714036 RepID=UPI002416F73A|nr:hypothetical protein [Companilactobacillus pabuli]MDG5112796.1 hypothetical protein [Companilactobacillus pabuli]
MKIMYGSQEIGGTTKLEPGTILYMSNSLEYNAKDVHLFSATKNWSNLNGINVGVYSDDFEFKRVDADIPSDDFKNLDIEKEYTDSSVKVTVSISIVDGEYRLNINTSSSFKFMVKAI